MMRILHISDLHVRRVWLADQNKIISAFLRDLQAQHEQGTIDAVVLSGDIAFSAQSDEFHFAQNHLLNPIQEMLGIDRTRMVLAPGNHDVDISLIDQFAEDGMRGLLTDRTVVNRLLDDESQLGRAIERMRPWVDFHRTYYEGASVDFLSSLTAVHRFSVAGKSVAIATLNSAWRATGAGDDADRAHLLIGDRQLSGAAAAVAGADIRIAVMHHPINWLAEFDQNDAKRELNKGFHILCTGHTHVNEPRAIQTTLGQIVHSAAGSLYNSREYANSYSIIEFQPDGSGGNVKLRTYYESRDEFDIAVNVARNGVISFSFEEASSAPDAPITAHKSSDLAASALLDLVRERSVLSVNIPDDPDMNDLLIPPVLLPLPLEQYLSAEDPEEGGNAIERDDLRERLGAEKYFILAGGESSGLTSAMQWLAYQAYALDPDLAPILIDQGGIGPGKDPVAAAVRKELALAGIPAGPKDPLPKLALAIDATDLGTSRKLQRVIEFIRSHPENTYIVGCRPDDESIVAESMQREGLKPCTRYLGIFGRRELRSLVALVGSDRAEEIVTAVLSLLSRERLPRTPAMMAALISIIAAGSSLALGDNDTAVLEAYLGMLLGRGEEDSDRKPMLDYRQRQHILSSLAEKFVREDITRLSRMQTERFLLDYFEGVGWSEPPGDVIKSLVTRRVLAERDHMVSFRHPMLKHLLVALGVQESDDLRSFVLADPLRYAPVIRHVAALRRSDKNLLHAVWELYKTCRGSLGLEGAELFKKTALKEGWGGDDDTAALLKRMLPPEPSEIQESLKNPGPDFDFEEALDKVEALFSVQAEESEETIRRKTKFADFSESLDLMAAVLRNSELVQDIPLKNAVLRDALSGHAEFAAILSADMYKFFASLDLVEKIVRSSGASEDEVDEVVERIALLTPVLAAWASMANSMASSRLVQSVSRAMADNSFIEDPGQALMGVMLAQQMRHPEWVKFARTVVERHGDRKVIVQMIRITTMLIYMDPSTPPRRERELEELISSAMVAMRSFPDNRVRGEVRARIARELRTRRQRRILDPSSRMDDSIRILGSGDPF
ncbi:metallophosphoesterase [Streptomyces sp. NPDC059687]|uniref:metallophosphoesterase n=1 Tax=Streptomyces sp. NPDC059687 TaxID=3346905 RepID=UPI0036BF1EB5